MGKAKAPRIYRKRMKDVIAGDVVAGDAGGWWRVTKVHPDKDTGTVQADAVAITVDKDGNVTTGRTSWIQGNANDYRDLVDL